MIIWFFLLFRHQCNPIDIVDDKAIFPKSYNKTFMLFAIILFLLAALRYWWVGGPDTHNYVYYFQGIKTSYYYFYDPITDKGFILVADFIRFITKDEQLIILFMSSFILIPIMLAIYKLSGDRLLAIVYFFVCTAGLYSGSYSAEKQYFSISVTVAGFLVYNSDNNKAKLYGSLLMLSSCLFHLSAIGTLLFIFFSTLKVYSNKVLYTVLLLSFLVLVSSNIFTQIVTYFSMLTSFVEPVSERAFKYTEQISNTNIEFIKVLPLNLFAALLVYLSNINDNKRKLFQAFVFSICFYNIVCVDTTGIRMSFGPMIVGCLGIPSVLGKKKIYDYFIYFILLFEALRHISIYNRITETRTRFEPWFDYSFFFEHLF
jgi:hypothetical protein